MKEVFAIFFKLCKHYYDNGCKFSLNTFFFVVLAFQLQFFQPATFEKMEKADILQMTVEYMKRLASLPVTSDQSSIRSYSSGYDECHRVAHAYLRSTRMEHNMKSRLACHEPSIVTRDVICVCRPRQRYSNCDATTDNAVYLGGTELSSPECGYGVSPKQSTTVCITTPLRTNVSVNVDSVWRPW